MARFSRTRARRCLSLSLLVWVAQTGAESRTAVADVMGVDQASRVALRHCDPDDAERLVFLEGRLEENAPYARWWWRGWAGVYVTGIGLEGTRALLEDDQAKRANSLATVAKSTIGLGRALFSYPEAALGVRELEDPPIEDATTCRDRLELAEGRLRKAAEEAHDERWSWIPHAVNFGLNAGAAVFVAETYDHDEAYWSGALGLAVGEVRTWSYPWQAEDDWEQYESRFAEGEEAPSEPEVTFDLEPTPNGARVVIRF
jgi:hypothetical protein